MYFSYGSTNKYIWNSSEYKCTSHSYRILGRSLTYIENNKGPSTDPYGIPLDTYSLSNDLIIFVALVEKLNIFLSLVQRMLWFTESKAVLWSRSIKNVTQLLSSFCLISSTILVIAVIQLPFLGNPDCFS